MYIQLKNMGVFINTMQPWKITGKMDDNIHLQLYAEALEAYIKQKPGLTEGKFKDINIEALCACMSSKHIHQRASIAKPIHHWLPTNTHLSHQNRHHTNLCPQHKKCPEAATHISQCNHKESSNSRKTQLYAS